jgi:hypothetical protein
MHILHGVAIFVALCSIASAQSSTIAPLGVFEIPLERAAGRGATITHFVARGSRLYLVVSNAAGSVLLQADREGMIQSSTPLGSEHVTGFDVDETGSIYALYEGRLLTVHYPWSSPKKSLRLDPPISGFAVVGGKPMGVSADATLHSLDSPKHEFTLAAYSPPWMLFAVGKDRLGVLRPDAGWVHVLQVDGIWSTHSSLGISASAEHPINAAALPDGRIFLLGSTREPTSASIIECDEHAGPVAIFDYALPERLSPRMIGITSDRMYLADANGRVAFYAFVADQMNARVVDSRPELVSDLAPFREACRKAGYQGRVSIQLVIDENGAMQKVRTEDPAGAQLAPDVMDAIHHWHFKSGIKAGKSTAMPMVLDVEIP